MKNIYYQVGNVKFPTQNLATLYRNANLQSATVEFICGPTPDFSLPYISFKEAVSQRCKQLRSKYKYLQLLYSGGSDSHTVLKWYVDNNVPIDEIVMSRWSATNEFTIGLQNSEINDLAIPLLNKYSDYLHKWKVKITYADFGIEELTEIYSQPTNIDLLFFDGVLVPTTAKVVNFFFPDLMQHENMCQIVGWEKPTIQKINNSYYTFMVNKTFTTLPITDYQNSIIEPFYFSDDFPEIAIAQYRQAKDLIIKYMPNTAETCIFSNINKPFVDLFIEYARDASECGISNSIAIGKSYNGTAAQKEVLLFTAIRDILPNTWVNLTSHCGTTEFNQLVTYCSFNPTKNYNDIPAIMSHFVEIK